MALLIALRGRPELLTGDTYESWPGAGDACRLAAACAADPSALVTYGALADAVEEHHGRGDRAADAACFALRWCLHARKWPGRRTDVRNRPWVWVRPCQPNARTCTHKTLWRAFPHAVLPREVLGVIWAEHASWADAVFGLANRLTLLRELLLVPHADPLPPQP